MRRGEQIEVTGWLNLRDGHLVLRVEGGGMWRLDAGLFASIRAHRLLGKRIAVTGTRDGFDLIAVRRLRRVAYTGVSSALRLSL